MMRLLSIALLAATLSAQESNKDPLRVYLEQAITASSPNGWYGHRQSLEFRPNLPVRPPYDNNGALEAFYKPHHSHRKAWLTVGILIGSGVATGFLATRASHPPIGRPIMLAMPAPVTPVFGGVTFIGIGGPGVPVTVVTGGKN